MKKAILAVALLTISTASIADGFRWLHTTPELLVSVGGSIGETDKAVNVKFTVQEKLCYSALYVCVNPSVMWLVTEETTTTDFSDTINIGAGVDLKYKIPKGSNNAMYVEAGPYGFVKDTADGDRMTLHVGTGIEYRRVTVSVDSYGTGDNLYMLNVGYRL